MPARPSARIGLCNSGVMAFRVAISLGVLGRIGNANAKGEYYLTDAVEIAARGRACAPPSSPARRTRCWASTRASSSPPPRRIFQKRARSARRCDEGATLIAPETVWLSYDTKIGRDVIIEPNVFFGPGVTVEDGAEIMANCHIRAARASAQGARIGPFARLRPGAEHRRTTRTSATSSR